MLNEASAKLSGPLLVSETQLREAFDLVEEIRLQNVDASKKGSQTGEPSSIRVELADGQKYTVSDPADAFTLRNARRERINRIVIDSWIFSKSRASIQLGPFWWGFTDGAKLEVSGTAESNRNVIDKFHRIFDTEKDLLLHILSTPTWILSIILVAIVHFTIGLFSSNNLAYILSSIKNIDVNFLLGYLSIFWGIPVLLLTTVLHRLIGGWFGRAIFLWGGGQARYENRRKIILFGIYTLPVAVLAKSVANFYGVP